MADLDNWHRFAYPHFPAQTQQMLGAMCALRWPRGRELRGGGGGKHLSITCFLSEFDKTKPQTKWLGSTPFHQCKICFFLLWPSEPLLKGKLFLFCKMSISWPLALSLKIVYHEYDKITQLHNSLKWSYQTWKTCNTNSPCSKPWPIHSRPVFFLFLKGVLINSSRD